MRVGVVGAGVFGRFHAQKAAASDIAELVGIFDLDQDRTVSLADEIGTDVIPSLEALLESVGAVVVASPASTHAKLVESALSAGKHVLVEKPLALEGADALRLAKLASDLGLVLQVGHQERFVSKAMGLLDLPVKPKRIAATREGLPSDRALDVSVVDDLMIHDIDLALCLTHHDDFRLTGVASNGEAGRLDTVAAEAQLGECAVQLFSDRRAAARKRIMHLKLEQGEIIVDFVSRQIVNTSPFDIRLDVSDTVPDPLRVADESFYAACAGKGEIKVPAIEAAQAVAFAEAVRRACTGGDQVTKLDHLGTKLESLPEG